MVVNMATHNVKTIKLTRQKHFLATEDSTEFWSQTWEIYGNDDRLITSLDLYSSTNIIKIIVPNPLTLLEVIRED